MYEVIGYIASVVVAISLMMSSILRLRLLNLVGAVLFAIYGVLIGSVPVAVVNTFIIIINIWYLVRIFRVRESFHIVVVPWDSPFLRHFLDHSRADIRRFIAEPVEPAEHHLTFLVVQDVTPVGVVVAEPAAGGTLRVHLDYVLPGYRDFSIGGFLYGKSADFFTDRGIHRIEARATTRKHADYLARMGFERSGAGNDVVWVRQVGAALPGRDPAAPSRQ
jgi:hypothetical protein